MHRVLILIAGYPGTGKSYLCDKILKAYPSFQLISPDEIKEMLWDTHGYDTIEEKNRLIEVSWTYYYRQVEHAMQLGLNILSDYPFSDKQKPQLARLSAQYEYGVRTVRLTADLDILFERQKKRDLDPARHLGHILNQYHKGDRSVCRESADALLNYEEFLQRCRKRGYGTFSLGGLIELDVGDFHSADYEGVMRFLNTSIAAENCRCNLR